MTTALMVAVLLRANVPAPDVTSLAQVQEHMGQRVTLQGVVERVSLGKGNQQWQGTGVVLDDDTTVFVTYGAPPAGWAPFVGQRVRVEGLLSPSLTDHEQSLLAPHLRQPGAPTKHAPALKTLVGQRVRLAGLARDAKGGAVLLLGKEPLYLAGLERWPEAVQGKTVAVGGTLRSKQHLPVATKDTKGAISQGTSAASLQWVFEAPTWRLVEEPKR
jgi:cytochrome c-type biogenesis protein CcmE